MLVLSTYFRLNNVLGTLKKLLETPMILQSNIIFYIIINLQTVDTIEYSFHNKEKIRKSINDSKNGVGN